jgi:hypothetical protein
MPIKSLLIVVLLCLFVWLPVIFGAYNTMTAIILTLSFLVAGFIGDRILNKNKDENKSP